MAGMSLRVLFISFLICGFPFFSAATTECSGAAEECELPEGSSGAASLLQTKNKIAQHVSSQLTEDDDLETGEASEVATAVRSQVLSDGQLATVSFLYEGKMHNYKMTAQSLYSKDGKVTKYYAKGRTNTTSGRDLTQVFRVRTASKHALAFVHSDGTVRGMFKQHGTVVRVQPSPSSTAPANLMEVKTTGREHLLSRVDFAKSNWGSTSRPPKPARSGLSQVSQHDNGRVQEPTPVPEPPYSGLNQVGKRAKGKKGEPPVMEYYANEKLRFDGVPFFPGCYPNDATMHEMEIRLVLDVGACEKSEYGPNCDGAKSRVEQFIVDSNFILEGQINMRYVIKTLDQYFDRATAPSYGGKDCAGTSVQSILYAARDASANNGHAFMQVLTGCGAPPGVVGVAYVGTLCNNAYGVGVSMLASDYLTFLHESGHILGANHVFDDSGLSYGETGGIMDYYNDGYLDGVVQFNEQYSKDDICGGLTEISSCSSWKEATDAPAPAPTPPGPSAPSPCPPCNCPGETTTTMAPAPTTAAPTPAPTTPAPTPPPATPAPTPPPATPAPTPAPTTTHAPAPTPAPTTTHGMPTGMPPGGMPTVPPGATFPPGVCFSDPEWVDTYGDGCTDYDNTPSWCDSADTWAVNGVSAADVCCICGGSILGSGGAPAPTTTPGGRSTGGCTDNAAWVDSYGDGCSLYDSHPSWCDSAEIWAVGGVSAKDACCVCGGGA